MHISIDKNSFSHFPYPPDYTNGRTNNGGFDLIREPDKIGEITEAKEFPELRILLERLNVPNGNFITFGCEAGQSPDAFYGYIDFAFRDINKAQTKDLYQQMFNSFESWIKVQNPDNSDVILQAVCLEMADLFYHEIYFGYKISLFYKAQNQATAGILLNIVFGYLLNEFSLD